LKQAGLNIIVAMETNKKLKVTKGNVDHLMTYSRIPQKERALAGVPTFVN
jgi:hypothetical protein